MVSQNANFSARTSIKEMGEALKKIEQTELSLRSELEKQQSLNEFSPELQREIQDKRNANLTAKNVIVNQLRKRLLFDQANKLAQYQSELKQKNIEIDARISESNKLINDDGENKIVLDEYKKIDTYLYNTINDLAQKHLVCRRDELKLALAIRFSKFTDFDLEKSIQLSERIVSNLTLQITSKEKNKISFELISRDIDDEINKSTNECHFADVLAAIKQECLTFTARTEYLFTCLFDAKRKAYGNNLSAKAIETLLDQDNARRYLQEQVLDYLLKNTDANEFYLTFVNLGIDSLQAKIHEKDNPESMSAFNQHQNVVLGNLHEKLMTTYNNFFEEKNICNAVKDKLNHSEIQKVFFQMLTRGYMKHEREDYYNLGKGLSSLEVLAELDKELEKYSTKSPETFDFDEKNLNTTQKNKTAHTVNVFTNIFNNENFSDSKKSHQVAFFIKTIKPTTHALQQVKASLNDSNAPRKYINIINEEIKKLQRLGQHGMFKRTITQLNNHRNVVQPVIGQDQRHRNAF